ncbi:LIM-domain binding protein-domain-containing protein [Phellopilus nigrolimitatus]|nr:LIM-domain binding protein-domain-containing protein [Phellopilus nigrolimitatus]
MPGMPGVHHIPGAGPQQNAIPGGMQGHAGQQQHPNAGSPPRSGTGGHSQPQTPALPMTARPQSRAEQTAMLGFQGGVGQPPFGANMRQPVQHQPGQPGQMGHPYGVPGMGMAVGGRATPQQHSQSPMAALGSSPGGPVSGRPGSSAGPGGPGGVAGGLGTPNVVGQTGRAGPVPPGVTVPGLQSAGPFPTPAQQFEAQEAARASYMARMAQQNAQGAGSLGTPQRPASQAATHPHQGQPQYPSPMQSLVAQRTGSPAVHRQGTPLQQQQQPGPLIGTPTLAHAHHMGMAQPAPGPGPGVGPQQQQHPQQHAPQNRPPSRQVRTPSRQQNQPQAGPSRTPRMQQAALPATPGAGPSTGGGPPPLGLAMRPGVGLGVHPMQGPQPAPGQPQQPQQPQPPPSAGQQQQSLAHQQQNNAAAVLQQRPSPQDGANPAPMLNMPPFSGFGPRQPIYPVQQQAGLGRLLSFSDTLSQPRLPLSKEYWEGMVQDYFSPKAVVKITLWKDNAQQEAKPFDIGMPILPRFFLVTSQSGVNSMSINLENAKERGVPGNPYGSVVECPNAVWTFRYANGYIVTLRGPLTAYLAAHPNTMPQSAQPGVNGTPQAQGQFSYKIDNITFNSKMHEKALRVDAIEGKRGDPVQRTPKMKAEPSPGPSVSTLGSPPMDEERANGELVMHIEKATIPVEPVNAFGIPQATMRCLELAESVGQMSDLIEYSLKTNSGPLDALKNFARYIREQSHMLPPQNQNSPSHMMDAHLTNGVAASPAVTLYQSSPPMEPATTNSGGLQPPQNMAHRAAQNAAQGQGDTASPNMASTPSAQTPSAPPLSAGPTTSTSSTPMLAHANLKRKAGDTSSPTTAPSEQQPPPAKRAQRKRSVRHAGS